MDEDIELPPAEEAAAEVGGDINAKSKSRKRLIGACLLGASCLGVGALAYQMYFKPEPRRTDGEQAEKILTTARVAAGTGGKRGEAAAEELNVKVQQLDQDIAAISQERGTLSAENAALKQQLEAERADYLRAMEVLERNGGGRAPQAAALQSPGTTPAPIMVAGEGGQGPADAPFMPVGSGGQSGMMVAGEGVRPRRSLSTVRMAGSGASASSAAGPRVSGSGDREAGEGRGGASQYMSAAGQVFDSRNYVPPNAYAPARVLVGVDAQTGVTSGSDPKPVLFRLTGPAVHVGANGRYQTTDLTGCMVNGAAYGELSSEKVYIKLQRITCPAGNDRFSVASIEGYAAHRGKAGVRGNVITREGGLTGRALVAGTLQGLGNSLSQYTNQMNRSIGVTEGGMLATPQLNGSDVAAGAVGSGIGNAAGVLADYYVKRAEQYQPVIEMPTGIEVELVLLTGFQIQRPTSSPRR